MKTTGKFSVYSKYGGPSPGPLGSNDKLRKRMRGYRIYLVSGGSSYNLMV